MKISIIGTGYVGLVTGACLSETGNQVVCVDNNVEKIAKLNEGFIPIYEPGLEELVKSNSAKGNLQFTDDMKFAIEKTDICFISVGTPMGEDGSADLRFVLEVAGEIGCYMNHHMYIVDKSTVPVGTSDKVRKAVQEQLDFRNETLTFDVISNPEFLKEGNAVADALRPDRIVLGTDNQRALDVMRELYKAFMINTNNFVLMDIPSAEMTKYAANCMLAMKISFMNEIANICERVGADVNMVRMGIGSDRRIGFNFIYPGCGYGGSCFPKDVRALIQTAGESEYDAQLLKAVEQVNVRQKKVLFKKIMHLYGENLEGKKFAVWGLTFKPETDDMREAASVTIVNALIGHGAAVTAYDPKATREAVSCYLRDPDKVELVDSKYTALRDADAMILITEWAEFRTPNFEEMKKLMKNFVIFDGRNQYSAELARKYGFRYIQIGVKAE